MTRLAGANGTVLSQARRNVTHNKVQRILKLIRTGHLGAAMMAQSIKDRRIAGVIVNHVATLQRPPLLGKFLQRKVRGPPPKSSHNSSNDGIRAVSGC